MNQTRILIVDDQPLFRDLLRTVLSRYATVEIVGAADNPRDAVRVAMETRPEVVLMDIDLGDEDMNGIDAARQIKRARPQTGVVFLTSHDEQEYLRSVLEERGGGWSYLLKHSVGNAETIVHAIESSSWGYLTFDPAILDDPDAQASSAGDQPTDRPMIVTRSVGGRTIGDQLVRYLGLGPTGAA